MFRFTSCFFGVVIVCLLCEVLSFGQIGSYGPYSYARFLLDGRSRRDIEREAQSVTDRITVSVDWGCPMAVKRYNADGGIQGIKRKTREKIISSYDITSAFNVGYYILSIFLLLISGILSLKNLLRKTNESTSPLNITGTVIRPERSKKALNELIFK